MARRTIGRIENVERVLKDEVLVRFISFYRRDRWVNRLVVQEGKRIAKLSQLLTYFLVIDMGRSSLSNFNLSALVWAELIRIRRNFCNGNDTLIDPNVRLLTSYSRNLKD